MYSFHGPETSISVWSTVAGYYFPRAAYSYPEPGASIHASVTQERQCLPCDKYVSPQLDST